MREEFRAFILSILAGTVIGTLIGYGFSSRIPYGGIIPVGGTLGHVYRSVFFDRRAFMIDIIPPFFVLILSFTLSRKASLAWKDNRTRLFSVASMLAAYMFGIPIGIVLSEPSAPVSIISDLLFGFWIILLSSLLLILIPLAHSNILTIGVAYVITKGVKPRRRRVIVAFVLIFLICMASASPYAFHIFAD